MIRPVLLVFAASLATIPANAQRPDPPPAVNDIPMALALEATEAALSDCTAKGYKVTVIVSDSDYTTRVMLRADGAGVHTVDVGRRKNYTVLKTGMSSVEHAEAVGPQPRQPDGSRLDPSGDKEIFLAGGGIQIKKNSEVVGALSVSGAPGGDKDEACAKVGLAAIEGRL